MRFFRCCFTGDPPSERFAMSHGQNYQPGFPPQPPQQSPVKKGFGKLAVALVAVGALAVGCMGGYAMGGGGETTASAPAVSAGGNSQTAAPAAEGEPAEEPAADFIPKPSDFKVKIATIKKECFGTAGCIVTYRVSLAYGGPALPEDRTFTVSYDITGGEDPAVGSIEVTGTQISRPGEEVIQTPSSSSAIRGKVTQVLAS